MPRIIKNGYVVKSEDSVLIPAGPPEPKQLELVESVEEEDQAALVMEELRIQLEAQKAESESIVRENIARSETVLRDAKLEAAKIKQQAREEGFNSALKEKREEIKDCIDQVSRLMDELQRSLDIFLDQYERDVGKLALDIAGKVLERKLDEDDRLLADLVKKAVSSVRKADWIKVEVSEQLPKLIEYLQKELAQADGRVEISAKPGPKGACVIQTPEGVIDASISTQLGNLDEYFGEIR